MGLTATQRNMLSELVGLFYDISGDGVYLKEYALLSKGAAMAIACDTDDEEGEAEYMLEEIIALRAQVKG